MRLRRTLPLVCLLITAFLFATSPLAARDLRASHPAGASSWLAAMSGWLVSFWEEWTGQPGLGVPAIQSSAKSQELPPPPPSSDDDAVGNPGGNPGGSCIDPNGTPGSCG